MEALINYLLNTALNLHAPEWVILLIRHLLVATILFLVVPFQMLLLTYFERRVIARMQDRVGPNRVGWEGVLQPIADAVKMFTKEDIVPAAADKGVHLLATGVVVVPTMFMLSVLPWGPGMTPVDFETSLLFFFAISSVSAIGLVMGGWSGNNKFSLLGAMRAVAQMISYEMPAILSILALVLMTGSMSISKIVEAQGGLIANLTDLPKVPDLGLGWLLFTPVGFLAFVCFFISALAEGERTPFDIPEADSEIVAGYMTEYSGMKFGMFYLAQYVLNFALCAITATLFFGGWQGPGVSQLSAMGANNQLFSILAGALGVVYLLLKTYFFFFTMVWIRGAFPRLRIDQLMGLGWKFLLPLTLVNIFSAAIWAACIHWGPEQGLAFLSAFGPWKRWAIAFLSTLVINLLAATLLVRINSSAESSMPKLVEDQKFGAVTLP